MVKLHIRAKARPDTKDDWMKFQNAVCRILKLISSNEFERIPGELTGCEAMVTETEHSAMLQDSEITDILTIEVV